MNSLSFFLVVGAAALFGFIFVDLLDELGVARKKSRYFITALSLPLLAFASFMIYPLFTHGIFVLLPAEQVYGSSGGVFLWFTVALLVGTLSRTFLHFIVDQRKT